MPELSQNDLDLQVIEKLFAPIKPVTEQTLLILKLIVQYQGHVVPTQGAMLLFGKNKTHYFSDT